MRWAGIEATLLESGRPIARDGSGVIRQVFPAGALKSSSLKHRGYRGPKNVESRFEICTTLPVRLPQLGWNGHKDLWSERDDFPDALLTTLIAHVAHEDHCESPPEELRTVLP